MSKKIRIIIISIIIPVLIFLSLIIIYYSKPSKTDKKYEEKINKIINKIDKKEDFCLLLSSVEDKYLKQALDYYKDTYNINIDYLKIKSNNESLDNLIKKLNIDINKGFDNTFLIIENGSLKNSITGYFNEIGVRNLLIKNGTIDEKYNKIDALITEDYKNEDSYDLLYVALGDKSIFNYRKLLVKNNVKSYVLYFGFADQNKIEEEFDKKLEFKYTPKEQLPALIQVRNKEVTNIYTKIDLKEFEKHIKE